MRSDRTEEQGSPGTDAEARDGMPPPEAGANEEPPPADSGDGGAAAAELEASRERYLRLAAEFDNYRKRTERERVEARTRAQAQLVEQLLEPLDDLQRVADFTVENTTLAALLEGVQMVERKLLRVLEGAGLEVMDAAGQPFDPSRHEAIAMVEAETEAEDDTIADVFQQGYQFRDVLLRPARVRVKKHQG